MSSPTNTHQAEAAKRTLAMLNRQADEARAELEGLKLSLAEIQANLSDARATDLREANEHLVLAVLRAEAVADSALAKFAEATRTGQHDVLTNTANRELMVDRLHNAIALARRHGTQFAVLFVDLDDFKEVNDALGHVTGDKVLQQTASHLQGAVRESDTVSRYGGDEFVILLADVLEVHDAVTVAGKILEAIAEPLQIEGHLLHMSASIGIAVYPRDAEDAMTLISRADAAMYRSKRRQRGGYMVYREEIAERSSPRCTAEKLATASEAAAAAHDLHVHELREANEHLLLAALTAQESEAHAREARSRLTASLAMVAHELRAPLAPMRTAAELMSRAHADESLLGKLQAIIKGQVTHMTRLVDDLLDGSRTQARTFELLHNVLVEVADVLNLSIATCRPALDSKSQELAVGIPQYPLPVKGDPVRLVQIFNNLLGNASKYTPTGGRISITVEMSTNSIVVTVTDNGIGITAEALPHVFELFVREEHAMAIDSRGLGVGLAVVRDLVKAHGGSVVATSEGKNRGSQFAVTLPRASADH